MVRKAVIASVVALALVGVGGVAMLPAHADGGHHGYGVGGRDHSPWLMLIPIGLALLAAGLIAWLLLGRQATRGGVVGAPAVPSTTAGAEAILAERLARGEIAPDEYHHLLAVLRSSVGGPEAGAGAPVGATPPTEPPVAAASGE